MSTPITAAYRIQMFANVPGAKPHAMRFFCNATASGDADGFDLVGATGGSVGMSVAVPALATLIAGAYSSGTTIGDVTLEQYLTGAWIPVGADTTSIAGTGGGSPAICSQFTATIRTTTPLEKWRFILMETAAVAPPQKAIVLSGVITSIRNIITDLLDDTSGHSGFWVRSRGNRRLASFISSTSTLNKKIRRERGLE